MNISVIGVDCATDGAKVGVACGQWSGDALSVRRVTLCRAKPPAEVVSEWIRDLEKPARRIDWPQDRIGLQDLQHRLQVRPRRGCREARRTRDESAAYGGPICRGERKKKIRLTRYSHKISVSH